MTQNYKPAYPAEFRQQMVELVALGVRNLRVVYREVD
ncbi:hypothetical protein SAMN05216333_12929 [Nitrosomonas oligotropha]|uniref:Transposase n=1 Tax=Nitrosomonas oligotropha TaxID=42354 RepID=A0A1H8TZZ4_9PROT|nr:hypothetical protein SAMN05216300_1321 [Nitrosomonas oligotropha]SEO96569.1 hypothetical protein SAMN05216333_12929 [Nitrosomonas oligotropha]